MVEKLEGKVGELGQAWTFPIQIEAGSVVLAHCAICGPSSLYNSLNYNSLKYLAAAAVGVTPKTFIAARSIEVRR